MNIEVIIIIILAAIILTGGIVWFVRLPKETKIKNLKEWLKWAVIEAEKKLGSGTGQLKLRMVYDMAVSKFPWLETFITFDQFSKWVDEALEWMDEQLSESKYTKQYVSRLY